MITRNHSSPHKRTINKPNSKWCHRAKSESRLASKGHPWSKPCWAEIILGEGMNKYVLRKVGCQSRKAFKIQKIRNYRANNLVSRLRSRRSSTLQSQGARRAETLSQLNRIDKNHLLFRCHRAQRNIPAPHAEELVIFARKLKIKPEICKCRQKAHWKQKIGRWHRRVSYLRLPALSTWVSRIPRLCKIYPWATRLLMFSN